MDVTEMDADMDAPVLGFLDPLCVEMRLDMSDCEILDDNGPVRPGSVIRDVIGVLRYIRRVSSPQPVSLPEFQLPVIEAPASEIDGIEHKFDQAEPRRSYTFVHDEEVFEMSIPDRATVGDTKEFVAAKFRTFTENVKLLHCGEELKDMLVLLRQAIRSLNRIVVLIRDSRPQVHRKLFSEWEFDFSRLEKVRRIGGGSFGTVKLMKDRTTGDLFAVKFLRPPESGDMTANKFFQVFIRECEVSSHLSHRCILRFMGHCLPKDDNCGKIMMEYMDGGSLAKVIGMSPPPSWLDWTWKSKAVTGLVYGMRYVHSQDVIHRDLKPSNILLDCNQEIRIGDFGSSTLSTLDATQTRECGTLSYMAPEQRGDDYTNKVDVYSFGLIFYEILTGVKVFPSDLGIFGICEAARSGQRPDMPSWIAKWVGDLIAACWSVDPDVRPSFGDIADELKRHKFVVHQVADIRIDDISAYVRRIESD
jgi:hypothetical protein